MDQNDKLLYRVNTTYIDKCGTCFCDSRDVFIRPLRQPYNPETQITLKPLIYRNDNSNYSRIVYELIPIQNERCHIETEIPAEYIQSAQAKLIGQNHPPASFNPNTPIHFWLPTSCFATKDVNMNEVATDIPKSGSASLAPKPNLIICQPKCPAISPAAYLRETKHEYFEFKNEKNQLFKATCTCHTTTKGAVPRTNLNQWNPPIRPVKAFFPRTSTPKQNTNNFERMQWESRVLDPRQNPPQTQTPPTTPQKRPSRETFSIRIPKPISSPPCSLHDPKTSRPNEYEIQIKQGQLVSEKEGGVGVCVRSLEKCPCPKRDPESKPLEVKKNFQCKIELSDSSNDIQDENHNDINVEIKNGEIKNENYETNEK